MLSIKLNCLLLQHCVRSVTNASGNITTSVQVVVNMEEEQEECPQMKQNQIKKEDAASQRISP